MFAAIASCDIEQAKALGCSAPVRRGGRCFALSADSVALVLIGQRANKKPPQQGNKVPTVYARLRSVIAGLVFAAGCVHPEAVAAQFLPDLPRIVLAHDELADRLQARGSDLDRQRCWLLYFCGVTLLSATKGAAQKPTRSGSSPRSKG